jgi:plasmid stabilization system protein ParE
MPHLVVITEAAWADMLGIGRAIQRANPQRAASFVAELYERCNSLSQFPASCPLAFDPKARGIRRLVHGDYLIFFRITGMMVEVLHMLHGAREYERLLFPEDQR